MGKNIFIGFIIVLFLSMIAFLVFPKIPQISLIGNKNTPVTSIRDALSKPLSLECNFIDEQGRQAKLYIKNGLLRSDYTGKTPEEAESDLITKEKIYVWRPQAKQGFVANLADPSTPRKSGDGQSQKEDYLFQLEKQKDSCKSAVVSDTLFVFPSDVIFKNF